MEALAVVWRQLDGRGMEHSRLTDDDGAPLIEGTAVVVEAAVPWRLTYEVRCDIAWRTRSALVSGRAGATDRRLTIDADGQGRWTVDGQPRADLDGCLDVDLGFTPSTNTLPLRRLRLAIGADATIDVAWMEFPGLAVTRAAQRYTRLAERTYRFEHLATGFVADLDVDADGFVVTYPDGWTRLA